MSVERCGVKKCLARQDDDSEERRCIFQFDNHFDIDRKRQKVLIHRFSKCANEDKEIFDSMNLNKYKTKW